MKIIRNILLCLFISANVNSVSAINWGKLITPSAKILCNRIKSSRDPIILFSILGIYSYFTIRSVMADKSVNRNNALVNFCKHC